MFSFFFFFFVTIPVPNTTIVFFDVTWQCGLLAATCYVFGLADTASNVKKKKRNKEMSLRNNNLFFEQFLKTEQ